MKTIYLLKVSNIVTSFIASLVFCSLHVDAQKVYRQKLFAYKVVHTNSNIFINDTSHADKIIASGDYLIYVELPQADTPIWHSAIIGRDTYSVHSTMIAENPLVVGERKSDKRLIKIRSQPGNHLWKLEFDMAEEKMPDTSVATEETVILKGSFKSRKVTSTIRGLVELQP